MIRLLSWFSVVMWSVRTDLLVVDCDRFFSLIVNCSCCAFSTSFLCSFSMVSPMSLLCRLRHNSYTIFCRLVPLLFRFYFVLWVCQQTPQCCVGMHDRGHPVLLQHPIKPIRDTVYVWNDNMIFVVLLSVTFFNAQDRY